MTNAQLVKKLRAKLGQIGALRDKMREKTKELHDILDLAGEVMDKNRDVRNEITHGMRTIDDAIDTLSEDV